MGADAARQGQCSRAGRGRSDGSLGGPTRKHDPGAGSQEGLRAHRSRIRVRLAAGRRDPCKTVILSLHHV